MFSRSLLVFAFGLFTWSACSPPSPSPSPVTASDHPESVLVDFFDGGHHTSACSGTLVAPRVVLTAAHCAGTAKIGRVTAPNQLGKTTSVQHIIKYAPHRRGGRGASASPDLALLVLYDAIKLPHYPTVQANACHGCSAVHLGRAGSTIAASDVARLGASSSTAQPGALVFPRALSKDAGGAVVRADGHIVGVMLGHGTESLSGYVAPLDDPKLQAWLKHVVKMTSTPKTTIRPQSVQPNASSDTGAVGGSGAGTSVSADYVDPVEPGPPPDDGANDATSSSGSSRDQVIPGGDPRDGGDDDDGSGPPVEPADGEYAGTGILSWDQDGTDLDITQSSDYWGTAQPGTDDDQLVANESALADAGNGLLFVVGTHGDYGTIESLPPLAVLAPTSKDGASVLLSVCFAGLQDTNGNDNLAGRLADAWGVARENMIACTGETGAMEGATQMCDGDFVDGNSQVINPQVAGVGFTTGSFN
jgi:hypothetical protein